MQKLGVMPQVAVACWSARSEDSGVHRLQVGPSDGYEEQYRHRKLEGAIVFIHHDELVGQRWGKVEPALWGANTAAFPSTSIARFKVCADGTVWKNHT